MCELYSQTREGRGIRMCEMVTRQEDGLIYILKFTSSLTLSYISSIIHLSYYQYHKVKHWQATRQYLRVAIYIHLNRQYLIGSLAACEFVSQESGEWRRAWIVTCKFVEPPIYIFCVQASFPSSIVHRSPFDSF